MRGAEKAPQELEEAVTKTRKNTRKPRHQAPRKQNQHSPLTNALIAGWECPARGASFAAWTPLAGLPDLLRASLCPRAPPKPSGSLASASLMSAASTPPNIPNLRLGSARGQETLEPSREVRRRASNCNRSTMRRTLPPYGPGACRKACVRGGASTQGVFIRSFRLLISSCLCKHAQNKLKLELQRVAPAHENALSEYRGCGVSSCLSGCCWDGELC